MLETLLCVHCKKNRRNRARGLCNGCYRNPEIKKKYRRCVKSEYLTHVPRGGFGRDYVATQIALGRALCVHCKVNLQSRPRGLCNRCCANEETRQKYPPLGGGGRRSPINGGSNSPLAPVATVYPPCDERKHEVLAERAMQKQAIFHPEDADTFEVKDYDPPMGWADDLVERIVDGADVSFRVMGTSLAGVVDDTQVVTITSFTAVLLRTGDVILCHVGSRDYLRIIRGVEFLPEHGRVFVVGTTRSTDVARICELDIYGKLVAKKPR